MKGEVVEKADYGDVVIDISESDSEILCRICRESDSELIRLGCDCKGEIGLSHYHCAVRWFSRKRNRECEICGKTAVNISYADVARAAPAQTWIMGVFVFFFMYVSMFIFFANSGERESEEEDYEYLNISTLIPLLWQG